MNRRSLRLFLIALAVFLLSPAAARADGGILDYTAATYSQPDWGYGEVTDINDSGVAVGIYIVAGIDYGFRVENGQYTDIIPLNTWLLSSATAINNNGDIVGFGHDGIAGRAFLYSGGAYTVLSPPLVPSKATDVNDNGQIVGTGFQGGTNLGFLYESGSYTVIDPSGLGFLDVWEVSINSSGLVAGYGMTGSGLGAFLYDDGTYTPISPLPGWSGLTVAGISDQGQVAVNLTSGGQPMCVLYDNGSFSALSAPGWVASGCFAMNGSGGVFGWGRTAYGLTRYYVYRDGQIYWFFPDGEDLVPAAMNNLFQIGGYDLNALAPTATVISLLPRPKLTAGGSDGPVVSGPAGHKDLRLEMTAWSHEGEKSDWWLVAQTPGGIYSYNPFARAWSPGITVAAGIPLRDVKATPFPPAPYGGGGLYTYYFGTDNVRNGKLNIKNWRYDILTSARP